MVLICSSLNKRYARSKVRQIMNLVTIILQIIYTNVEEAVGSMGRPSLSNFDGSWKLLSVSS